MATAPLTYVAGTDPETLKANQAYQEALTRLTESLEGRKNRMFDPQLLALAEGLLTPGRTGSFFEGLGTAAGKMRAAEELEEKRAQEIAQAQLGLAEKGLTLAQRMALDREYARLEGKPTEAPRAAPPGAPAPSEGKAPEPTDVQRIFDPNLPPPGMTGPNVKFIQVHEPNNTIANEQNYIRQARREGMPVTQFMEKVRQFNKDRYQFRDNRVYDSSMGRVYYYDTGETVKVSTSKGEMTVPRAVAMEGPNAVEAYVKGLPGAPDIAGRIAGEEAKARLPFQPEGVEVTAFVDGKFGTFKIPSSAAVEYNRLVGEHGIQSPQAMLFMQKFVGGAAPAAMPTVTTPAAGAPPVTPSGAPTAAPAGATTVPSKSQREIAEAVQKQYETTRAELAAKAENDIPKALETASEMAALSSRVLQNVDKSGRFVGLLSRPGIAPAALKLISEGIQAPGGTYKIPGVEAAILRTAGATAEDIANIEKLRGDFSQANLLFAQMFMRGQGAITEGERRIVENVGGSVELSPAAIRARIGLMRERAEFDKKVFNDFMDWKKANPQQTLRDYQSTAQYRNALKNYEDRTSSLAEETLPNVGSRPSSLPTKGQTFIYQGKTYEYVGPDNDMNAAKNRNNYREVK